VSANSTAQPRRATLVPAGEPVQRLPLDTPPSNDTAADDALPPELREFLDFLVDEAFERWSRKT
jgi:hypothetical protein